MQSFDLLGVGNSVVDVLYEVDEKFIVENKLKKGVMKLINEEKAEKFYLKGLKLDAGHLGINEYLGELYVQTGRIESWIHGLFFDLAFLHFMYTTFLEHHGFKENVELINELATLQTATANSSA